MSKSSGGAASAVSIADAIHDNRMFAERAFYCIANGAVNCCVTSRDATGRFHARMKICSQKDTKEAPLYEQKQRWRSQRGKHRRCDS